MSTQSPYPLDVIVMAAGKGTRMKSATPKVLHRLARKPLLQHVLELTMQVGARNCVIVTGYQSQVVQAASSKILPSLLAKEPNGAMQVQFALQEPQQGTGHAVQQGIPLLPDDGIVLILSGDVPLTQAQTVRDLVALCAGESLALLTVHLTDATGYGRIVRGSDAENSTVQAVVEHKDATSEQLRISEGYSGIMAVPAKLLRSWLSRLDNKNAQNEYYLTDIVKFSVADGVPVRALCIHDEVQVLGINSPQQLAQVERIYQKRMADQLMDQGVRLADPYRIDIRGVLTCGLDVEIDSNCIFEGHVHLEDGVTIGANCIIGNAKIEAGAVILPFTCIEGDAQGNVYVGRHARIGPFSRLRPGTHLDENVHIGNFVEVKNSQMGKGSKANHLAYIGDAEVGHSVNIGAGSITANYDGVNKHKTVIANGVHVGSNCVLVAPIHIGEGATIGAGSTLNKDAPAQALTVARSTAQTSFDWKRPVKK